MNRNYNLLISLKPFTWVSHFFALRQRIESIKKHCKTNPKKLMRTCQWFSTLYIYNYNINHAHGTNYKCFGSSFLADLRSGCCRKGTCKNTWLYYVELVIKGTHKLLGSKMFFFKDCPLYPKHLKNVCDPTRWFP